MIRVNLLRNFGKAAAPSANTSVGEGFGATIVGSAPASSQNEMVLKVVFLILPLLGVWGYGMYIDSEKANELKKVQGQMQAMQAEVTRLQPEIEAVDRFKKEKAQLQRQINTIKDLSKSRLQNVKALDAFHDIVPPKAWLTKLKFEGSAVTIEGYAKEDSVVVGFMKGLKTSIFFTNVRLIKTVESKSKDGVVKAFTVNCNLENL
jgi:Tfp pilus assembly protein PilN